MPLFETLEPRVLLATVAWDGGAGTNSWHDAMNWVGDVLPGPADDVLINVAGDELIEFTMGAATVRSINNWERFELSGGTIVATGGSQRGLMTMTGGVADGNGDLFIRGGLEWSGGSMRVHRAITEAGVDVTISDTVFLEGLFNSYGDLDWTGGNIKFISGLLINNAGLFTITSDGVALNDGGVNEIGNKAALMRQNSGADVTQTIINTPFRSGGTVTLASGHLRFNVSAKLYDDLTLADDTVLRFFLSTHFGEDVDITGAGNLTFAGGSDHNVRTGAHVGELSVINGADVDFEYKSVIERLTLNGVLRTFGGVDFGITITERARFLGGQLLGSSILINDGVHASLDFTGSFKLSAGVLNHGTLVHKGGELLVSNLVNHGDVFLSPGSLASASFGKTHIVNRAGGVITKLPGVTTIGTGADDDFRIINEGLIRVMAGELQAAVGDDVTDFESEGVIRVDDDAILKFTGGNFYRIYGGIEGGGAIRVSNVLSFRLITSNADIGEFIIDEGVKLVISKGVSIRRLTLFGDLVSNEVLTITERLDVYGGDVGGDAGDLHIAEGAYFVIHSDVDQNIDTINDGTVILKNDAEWRLDRIDFVNNGDLFIQSGTIEALTWHSSLLNTGVITKHTGASAMIINETEIARLLLTNTGEIRVNEGELVIHGGGESSGVVKAGALGALEFASRDFNITGGSVVGDGSVRFNSTSGSAWFAGSISVSTLLVDTVLTLKSAAAKTLDVDVLNVNADMIWRSGDLTFGAQTASIDGTLQFEAPDAFTPIGATALTIGAGGRLVQEGANAVDFGAATTLHSMGMVKVSGGELRFRPGAVENLDDDQSLIGGVWVVAGNGVLKLGEGVHINMADIRLRDAGSSFANLSQLAENRGALVIDDQHALHLQSDFTNLGTIDFDGGGALHVEGDYRSEAGSTTSFDVSDISNGVIVATGEAELGGLFQGRWDEPMNNPPSFIDLVLGAAVIDDGAEAEFINPPAGFDVALDFDDPSRARLRFTPM